MKFLVLVIVTVWSFGQPMPKQEVKIVPSVEAAAIKVYQAERQKVWQCEPEQVVYSLYEVDLALDKITKLDIPKLQFKSKE